MKILIIGHKGNLGSQLMETYADLNPIGWDREEMDITDEQVVQEKIGELKPELVFNCAAYNAVDKAEEDRVNSEAINASAVGYIAQACKAVGATLVHYSSGMVFEGNNPDGYSEDDSPNPVNAYGRSKLLGEMAAQENLENLYLIRTSWLFGKAGPSQASKKSFIDLMIEKGAGTEAVKVVDDEIGKPTYILDLAQASRALIETGKSFGVYHITNTGSVSRLDWAREIFHAKNLKAPLEPIKGYVLARMAKRPHYEVLNNTKFIELRPWSEALKDFLS